MFHDLLVSGAITVALFGALFAAFNIRRILKGAR